jgi:hypothetical protein
MTTPASGDVVHRLKNHLAIVVGFCDLLLADLPEGDARRADVLEIHKAGHDAMALIPEVARRCKEADHDD